MHAIERIVTTDVWTMEMASRNSIIDHEERRGGGFSRTSHGSEYEVNDAAMVHVEAETSVIAERGLRLIMNA
jgi:hypothetical protein